MKRYFLIFSIIIMLCLLITGERVNLEFTEEELPEMTEITTVDGPA